MRGENEAGHMLVREILCESGAILCENGGMIVCT